MEECHLRAVAEGLGDERWRALEDELSDGAVSGAEEADTEIAEPVHEGVGVQVTASQCAGKHPGAIGPRAGTEIRPP